MKTKLGFLTEEGRTRSKNAFRRFCAYAVLMFLIAGAGGYGIHRYWVSGNLTLLQRIYFKQYMKSSWRSSLFNSKSHYTTLERTVIDPHTKKEQFLAVLENDVVPALDDAGRLQYEISGMVFSTLDMVAQRLYLKGEPIRGTRELSPKKYARECQREIGVALKSYNQGSQI